MMGRRGSVLFVCVGNVCRSAMAEALFRDRARHTGKEECVWVRSAGIQALDGQPATDHAVEAMHRRGIDIRGHRARTITQSDIDGADLILVMTSGTRRAIERSFRRWEGKVLLLSEVVGKSYDVGDIYGEPLDVYIGCAERLRGIIEQGFDYILGILEHGG